MSRPTDARARKSREALRKAMLRLVEEEPFERISIRELAKTADVSHPTFYRNYESKEEILKEVAEEEIRKLWEKMLPLAGLRDPYRTARAICDHVSENRKLWTVLVTTSASQVLLERFIGLAEDLASVRPQFNPDFPTAMVSSFVAGGIIQILAWWLRQPVDYPVDHVAQFLSWLVMNPTIGPEEFHLRWK